MAAILQLCDCISSHECSVIPHAPPFPMTLGNQHRYPVHPPQREIRIVTNEAASHGKRGWSVKCSVMVTENDNPFLLLQPNAVSRCAHVGPTEVGEAWTHSKSLLVARK